jgi:hypothetical protein
MQLITDLVSIFDNSDLDAVMLERWVPGVARRGTAIRDGSSNRYEDVETFERLIPRLGVTPEAISSDRAADIIEFLACVIPTLTRDGLRNMRPRRLLALYLTVMPKVCTDPLALGRPSSEATSTAPSPASTTTPSEAA